MQQPWNPHDEVKLKELVDSHSNAELAAIFKRTETAIEKKLSKMKVRRTLKTKNNQLEPLFKRGYTEKELLFKFNFDFNYVEANCPEGFITYRFKGKDGQEVIKIMEEFKVELVLPKKKYQSSVAKNGQPYLWIKLTDNLERLKIIPIGDAHVGHDQFNREAFKELVEYIKNNDDVYCFFGGDMVELASKHSIGSGMYEQDKPTNQINDFIEMVAPISHKVLWYIGGNHDSERSMREIGIDAAQFIADKLQIPYFNEPVHVDIYWKNNCFMIFDQHGSSGSVTIGGKINKAMDPLKWQEFTHFVIMHHVHDKINKAVERVIRNRENFSLDMKKQYVVVCGSFLNYFGTYGARKGYAPTSNGLTSLKIYKDGDYHTGD